MKEKGRRKKPYTRYTLPALPCTCAGLALAPTMMLAIAIIMIMMPGMQAKPSTAYFTTYASAKGGYELQAGTETEIEEEITGLTKHIRIVNTGEGDCFVRVKVLAGSLTPVTYLDDSGKWSQGEGGYWYYQDTLPAGEATGELAATIEVPEGMEGMMGSFDIVVIQECTAVLYREDGTPYADWGRKIEAGNGTVEPGNRIGETDNGTGEAGNRIGEGA